MLKKQNPLTAKDTKIYRKDRKDLNLNDLALGPLRMLWVLCG